jgi:hypothetical protein
METQMANTILTPTAVTREALRILHQKLNFVGTINRQYDDSFAKSGAKIGDSLKIRLPNQYTVTTGAVMTAQDTVEESVTLQVATQKHVGMNFTSDDLTLDLDDFSKRIIDPAMNVLAAAVESDAMNMYKDVYQQVNNQAVSANMNKLLAGRKLLVDGLTPPGNRTANLNTQDNVDLVDALKGLFQDSSKIAEQYREGMMGRTGGFDFYENTLWPQHQRGGASALYTVNTTSITATSTAQSVITVATGTGTYVVGDIFTVAGVYRVHPETKVITGTLQQFVVTTAGTGAGGIAVSPSIITAGAKQNVSVSATSTAAVVAFAGLSSTNHGISMLYHKDAFTLVTADLVMPQGTHFAARDTLDGISLRIIRDYDINNDKFPCRVDVLYGYKTIRPQLAARFANL